MIAPHHPWVAYRSELALGLALIAVGAFFSFQSPYFLTIENATAIGFAVAVVGILAVGETLVIIHGGIDISVGSVLALTGVTANLLYKWDVGSAGACAALAFLVGPLAGLINGAVITRIGVNPLITTLAMYSIARGLAFVLSGGKTGLMDEPGFTHLGRGTFLPIESLGFPGVPYLVLVMGAVFILGQITLSRSLFGRRLYAMGGNEQAARLSGVPVNRYKVILYVVSSSAAALGGILLTAQLGLAAPQAARGLELEVIAAVILGGTALTGGHGNLLGTFLGVLILGVLSNGMGLLGWSSDLQDVARGVVLLGAVSVDGLRRRRSP